eukprot:TRINITY_DN7955_c0_g1_i1.p1 TRINITY_DN7955_c0_g1~~TRINITY_DN7955_c0_g1_i1.p1  ORF type:complete len:197 (-),score=23.78 TRINITY_DN7955_c0_g1_i1:321-911(-)
MQSFSWIFKLLLFLVGCATAEPNAAAAAALAGGNTADALDVANMPTPVSDAETNATAADATATSSEFPKKSKIVVVLFELIPVTMLLGIDRCYMGSVCSGVIKGLTLGGLGLWAVVDYWVIMINALNGSKEINTLGFQAHFPEDEINSSYWIALVATIFSVLQTLYQFAAMAKKGQEPGQGMNQPGAPQAPQSSPE